MLNQAALAYIDTRFSTERRETLSNIQAATCDFVKASKFITPNQIGTTYVNPTMVLDQHEIRLLDRGGCNDYRGF
jgi:hypothetical protein